ncbi:MAG: metal-dependent hydrolase [Actinobacteria bacterium]|nr:metal-dependent hydrolase [Actinomycetota bacterium]
MSTRSETHTIRARRVRFEWDGTPLHWIPGDPQTTHTINVLHLLLPAGEKWFVEVYRQALPLIDDPRLRDAVRGFMGQEAMHSRAHASVLDHLAAQGLDATPYTKHVDRLFEHLLGDRPMGLPLPRFAARRWLEARLAIIAAIEHFTAVLGNWVIDSPALDDAGADPVMLDLLRWHGAEEVEHRSVAFDLFQHISGSYWRRVLAMVQVVTVLSMLWVQGTRFFMRHDPTHPGKATWLRFIRARRRRRLPTTRSMARSVPRYLRRDYHPSREGSTEQALAYLAASPAARAAAA